MQVGLSPAFFLFTTMAREQLAETVQRLHELVEPVLEREGFELVAIEYSPHGKVRTLRVLMDIGGRTDFRPQRDAEGGLLGGVDVDACARVSRALAPVLDVEDVVAGAYHLEVSSPGIDRPLVKPADFERAAGMKVRVKTRVPVEGHKVLVGRLTDADDDGLALEVGAKQMQVPYRLIAKANLEYEF